MMEKTEDWCSHSPAGIIGKFILWMSNQGFYRENQWKPSQHLLIQSQQRKKTEQCVKSVQS